MPLSVEPLHDMVDIHSMIKLSESIKKELQEMAGSTSHTIWQIKRAKLLLEADKGKTIKQLVTLLRVPPDSVEKCLASFSDKGLAYLSTPTRKSTQREKRVESLLVFLNNSDSYPAQNWTDCTVKYIGCEFSAQNIYDLRQYIQTNPTATRSNISTQLCYMFNLSQTNGKPKHNTAAHIVKRMGMDNIIPLSEPVHSTRSPTAAVIAEKNFQIEMPVNYSEKLMDFSTKKIHQLHFLLTDSKEKRTLWREAIQRFHYIGTSGLFGAQLKYLVYGNIQTEHHKCETIFLGVLGFAASTWRLASRDQFICWTDEQREKNLQLIINNARFLILPWIKSKNLASRILSQISRQVANDWQEHYHYRPLLLETFVELDKFKGTCYKAANWQEIGVTKGYSLSHRKKEHISKKAIFIYPLHKKYKQLLCTT